MSYFLQLKMLLWKNLLIRKRQKFRCIVEVIWPLFLFLILMWVRTKDLREDIHECHFVQKAMPTAGGLPFLQSFFCTANNTCYKYQNDSEITRESMSNSLLVNLINSLQTFSEQGGQTQVQNMILDSRQLSQMLARITANHGELELGPLIRNRTAFKEDLDERNVTFSETAFDTLLSSRLAFQSLTADQLSVLRDNASIILCNETLMQDIIVDQQSSSGGNISALFSELCELSNDEAQLFISAAIRHSNSATVAQQLQTIIETGAVKTFTIEDWVQLGNLRNRLTANYQNLMSYNYVFDDTMAVFDQYRNISQTFQNSSWVEEIVEILNVLLCASSSTKEQEKNSLDPSGESPRFDVLSEQFKKRVETKYEYDPSLSKECNNLFKMFEENPILAGVWKIYKPFIRGKILYAPDTNATAPIMRRLNATIYSIRESFMAVNDTVQLLPLLRTALLENSIGVEAIKRIIDSNIGASLLNNSFVKSSLNIGTSDDDLKGMQAFVKRYLDDSNESNRSRSIEDAQKFIDKLLSYVNCIDFDKIKAYSSEEAATKFGMKLLEKNELFAVLVFENQNGNQLTPFVSYKIRMSSDRVDNTEFTRDSRWRPGPRMRPYIDLKYLSMGFGYLQDLIEHYIIAEHTRLNATQLPGIYLQQFPYPCHINDKFIIAISATFPLFMMLSWVYTCAMIVKSIVFEKEQRLKETMHVMGLGNGVHWLGWALDSILPMMFTILLLTFILTYGQILRSADPTLIYFFLLIYCVATIAQSFLISVFFSRANLAAASGGIIFFVLYLPYPFMVRWMTILPPYVKALMCLSSNVAFGVATSYFAFYEEQGTGAQWADINSSPLYGDQFNLLYVIYLLLIDTCLYLLLTWYLEAVMPGMYGVPKPWYFPFTSSYWCGTTKGVTDINVLRTGSIANENCESEPGDLKQGITIQSLSKVYSNGKVAVRDLSLNFYEGQITSFLGHNGAGKTSTISMLTGLLPPSSGTAKIYGMDIRTDMDAIRKSMGMCPQHNVLFNLLTVEEHLWLYARLRGGSGGQEREAVEAECDAMIVDLGLAHRRRCLASQLSGGMQRKLSVAIAFIGQSKTVILDEPTSGVDPYSRRSIWELLTKYKKGRTVVLTTHYMDEADILGDRIAIIAHGQLQCCGSSLYLKNRFGSGYYLTIDMREDKISSGLSSPEIKKITEHIKEIVPSANFHEHIGTELIYVLSHSDLDRFKKLFSFLEDFKADLFINSYGISDTSLEEIFLRVGSQADDTVEADDERDSSCFDKLTSVFHKKKPTRNSCAHRPVEQPENDNLPQANGTVVKYTSVPVMDDEGESIKPEGNKHWRQFLALHVKRFHHTRRNRKAIFSELILPGLFVCMALLVTSIVPKLQQRPPLTLAPSVYAPPHYTFASLNVTSPWQYDVDANLTGALGLGTVCLSNERSYDASCAGKSYDFKSGDVNVSSFGEPCSCKTGAHLCPAQLNRPVPPSLKLSSHDILFNLTGSNISDWILKTWKQYEKTRMAGYSMGFESPVPVVEFKSANESVAQFSQNPYVDIHYKTNNVKVWFNNKGWASSVSYLNAINNVILRSSLPAHKASHAHQYGIRAINHPMNFTEKQMNIELIKESGKSLLHAISVLFALSFVPASFLVYLIEDKVSSSKHLQMASGVNRLVYWLQAYSWDMCCYLLSAGLCVFIFLVFNEQNYVSSRNLAGFVILLAFYGWSIIPLMYPASFVFSVPSFAFVGLACANIFIGVITTVTTFVLGVFEDEDLRAVDAVLKEVFLIFPHFCLGDGLMKLAANHIYYFALQQYIDVEVKNEIFKWDYLGKNLTCMFLSGIFYFLLTLFLEFRGLPFWSCSAGGVHNVVVSAEDGLAKEDEDVRAERIRINQNQAIDDILVIKNLTKVYSRFKDARPAVNQVCAGIKRGECFGLLGLNGAGKTTTFKMLTGAVRPSGGDALIGGCSVSRDVDGVRAQLGYCPQFDALDPLLTPREHLVFYARLRNIPSRQLQSVVDASLMKLGLGHYSDRCAGTLSGGNKRKLSTAIAILGNPPVIFLDEPTSGMDPRARRFLWSCVRRLTREAGRSMVLTSHSMEECQALCTRLTVMVNGHFKCLGSSQHLKNKFGGGYSLSLHCADSSSGDRVTDVKNYISSKLPDATLQEHHHTRLRYQLLSKQPSLLANVFQVMEEARATALILDYSRSQTTLEDVFLQFASEQGEADEDLHSRHARPAVIRNCFKCCTGNE
uniref:ATP-binding cassette sub-family A member 1 n=1 Tax=Laodelphax striatellus TaxID=195883 RepID=A0A158UYN9_LAOST|nr:ATP-binding cassette sub-family A member 1 [Laodelphax striatellus]